MPNALNAFAQFKTQLFIKLVGDLRNILLDGQGNPIDDNLLNENELSGKENDLNTLLTNLITDEETFLNNMMKPVIKEINKVSKGPKINVGKTKIKQIKIKIKAPPTPLKSGVVVNPVYKDYASFRNAYIKAYDENKKGTRATPFNGNAKTEKGYKGAWTRYLASGKLAKENYFA